MSEDWAMIRVRALTLERLQLEMQRQYIQYGEGRPTYMPNVADGVSLDRLILAMLNLVERHRVRARKQAARKAGRGAYRGSDHEDGV
jgi:hypothetical protein